MTAFSPDDLDAFARWHRLLPHDDGIPRSACNECRLLATLAATRKAESPASLREALEQVRVRDEDIRAALDRLGKPGDRDEAVVFVVVEAFLNARAALSGAESPASGELRDVERGTTFEQWGAFVAEVARTQVRVYDGANPDASMTLARLVEKAQSLIDPTSAEDTPDSPTPEPERLTMCWPACGCDGEQPVTRCVAVPPCTRCEDAR